jgi:PPIC-type PPIASE domain
VPRDSSRTVRWLTTSAGVVAVTLATWVAFRGIHGSDPRGREATLVDAAASSAPASDIARGKAAADPGSPLLVSGLANLPSEPSRADAGAGTTMPGGAAVPALPPTAPRQVRFGVVLVTYDGAQPPSAGGHVSARSHAEAQKLADKLAATAAQDFQAAVQQGDAGSSEDVGRVKLGVLEPAPEYVLFTLPVDGVGGPVDTPRGFWIVKRLE